MSALLQLAMERVQDNMDDILSNFKADAKITVLVRTPGKPTADFCMTSDTLDEVAAMIERRKTETPSPQSNLGGIVEALREALEPFADQSEFWSEQVSDRTPLLEKDNLKVGDVRRAAKAVDEYRRWKAAQAQPAGTVAADQNAAATSRPLTPAPETNQGR